MLSIGEWFGNRDILITGVTSELGRALLEKILRSMPNVQIKVILRSRDGLSKEKRIERIFASPGYNRLRQQEPDAISRVKVIEGNLIYKDLGLGEDDIDSLKSVEVAFHAAGPYDDVFDFCNGLPHLKSIAVATSLFIRHNGHITESLQNEDIPENLPLALVRIPFLGPAHKEPMPGFVEILRGPTALMVGAGFAFGRSDLPAEVLPIDLVVNALIVAASERKNRSRRDESTVYNVQSLDCTWGDLVSKGSLSNKKFSYPTFGIRGITSVGLLHWIVVLLLEWMPSYIWDKILLACGAKSRCIVEYEKVRKALRSLDPIAATPWPVVRNRIYQLDKRLNPEDSETFSICQEIDLELYILCAAAAARKYCVNDINIKIVNTLTRLTIAFIVVLFLYLAFK